MVDLLLVYPYFNDDTSIFKFPPLGLGYIASYVRSHGFSVDLIDCTFIEEGKAVAEARRLNPRVIGIYSMLSMKEPAIRLARSLRKHSDLTIAGGPLPTTSPKTFLNDFDVVVIGEGEETVLEILESLDKGEELSRIHGIAYRERSGGRVAVTPQRTPRKDLDCLPFPARDLYNHQAYKEYFQKHHGYTITSMITSRGCPFNCDFCSRPVFGRSHRGRTPSNIVDEMESITAHGYERIWFADDIFPINKKTCMNVCNEILMRRLDVSWECLCRADLIDMQMASRMKRAGCHRVFFGLESGNNQILRLMNKQLTVQQARKAVNITKSAGIRAGGFFILGYPGETNDTMLDTLKFASSLPLDYLSLTVPYPIPGTELYRRLEDKILVDEWKKPRYDPSKHVLLYQSEFSMHKLRFGMMKAKIQQKLKHQGSLNSLIGKIFEQATDRIFKYLR